MYVIVNLLVLSSTQKSFDKTCFVVCSRVENLCFELFEDRSFLVHEVFEKLGAISIPGAHTDLLETLLEKQGRVEVSSRIHSGGRVV